MKCTDKEWQHCRVEKMGCPGCYYDENKIQVGYYVRTNEGIIGKIKRIEFDKTDKSLKWYVFDKKRPDLNVIEEVYINKPYIVQHSKNIKDLIIEEDILRYKLKGLKNEYITVVKKYYDARSNENWLLINGYKLEQVEILEILTKEQYKENCFKVVQK